MATNMESTPRLSASSRVKACTECRQQKLRCDAAKDNTIPCSRCRRRGQKCEITTAFRRTKRRTKKDLQAELESLREKVSTNGPAEGSTASIPSYTALNQQATTSYQYGGISVPQLPQVLTPSSFNTLDNVPANATITSGLTQPSASDIQNYISSDVAPSIERALPQTINELKVSSEEVDACFTLFHERYLHYVPIYEGRYRPNACYMQSEFLFWAIVAVGARKYTDDPTLLSSLAPHLIEVAGRSAFSRDKSLPTIQALILLCAFPLPHDSLSKDISLMLAGSLLQHAVAIGLHVYGIGQDFSRTKLKAERAHIQYRARLWLALTNGIPPPIVSDTYSRERSGKDTTKYLPIGLVFAKKLSAAQTEGIIQLERQGLATPPDRRAAVLHPLIDLHDGQLQQIALECTKPLGRFYLQSARLQLHCFHLFVPREAIEDIRLHQMYDLACSAIETAQTIDSDGLLSNHAPAFVSRYLHLCAFAILKIARSHLSDSFDAGRGRRAYFYVISFHRNQSIQNDDVESRATAILTQLWTSKEVFKRPDGSYDSLSLRCGSRLAMSVVFDCYWWWRSEFAGLPFPYNDRESIDQPESAARSRPTTPPPAPSAPTEQTAMLTEQTACSTPFTDVSLFDMTFPESQWATSEDLMSLDWSSFQYDTMMPFDGLQGNPTAFDSTALWT